MTTKAEILRIIRAKCIDCCCGSRKEVALCTCTETCPIHPLRLGMDPKPSKGRGFAKPSVYTASYEQDNDPPPKEKTPACAGTQNRGEIELPLKAKSKDVPDA
jgi:hypothetical protein